MNTQDKKPTVWTHLQDFTKGDQRYSFFQSEKGAIKLERHTAEGNRMVFCVIGEELQHVAALAEEIPAIVQAVESSRDAIQANKARIKEQQRLEREKAKAIDLQVRKVQAAKEQERQALANLEQLTGKKLVG